MEHKLVQPPVGRLRIASNNMLAVGKAHANGNQYGRGVFSKYNGTYYDARHAADRYWEVWRYAYELLCVIFCCGFEWFDSGETELKEIKNSLRT